MAQSLTLGCKKGVCCFVLRVSDCSEKPCAVLCLCLLGEEATKGSHRSPTNIAKDKQACSGKRDPVK
jgi:hypothetical protein